MVRLINENKNKNEQIRSQPDTTEKVGKPPEDVIDVSTDKDTNVEQGKPKKMLSFEESLISAAFDVPPQSLIIEQIRSNAGESYINEFVCKKNPVLEIDNIAGTQNITESEICTDNCIIIPEDVNTLLLKQINGKLEKVFRKVCNLETQIQDLNSKVNNVNFMEKTKKDFSLIITRLQIKSEEEMNSFEADLQLKEFNDTFRDYAESVGGHSPKANISRILKRTFCDELACKCSWLGQRGNIKVCDLKLINILEDVITNAYPDIKKKGFEEICKEWFRLAGTRLRNKKKCFDS